MMERYLLFITKLPVRFNQLQVLTYISIAAAKVQSSEKLYIYICI